MARVRNYRLAVDNSLLVYHTEKPLPDTTRKTAASPKPDPKLDSARRVIDSLQAIINGLPPKVKQKYLDLSEDGFALQAPDNVDAEEPGNGKNTLNEVGGNLVWVDLSSGREMVFKNVMEFTIDSIGGRLIAVETGKIGRDSLSKARIVLIETASGNVDTLAKNINEARFLRFDEAGRQLAYVAEVDSSAKALRKFYKLYYHKIGVPGVQMVADRNAQGKKEGWTVSENAAPRFSKSGKRLFFGVAPVLPLKDTSKPEFERVNVDVWHYKDDYLMTQQLASLGRNLSKSYTAVYYPEQGHLVQLSDETLESVSTGRDGDLPVFLGSDNRSYRIESQWTGSGKSDIYTVDPMTGTRNLLVKGLDGQAQLSESGRYVAWYDRKARQYFTWSDGQARNISKAIKFPVWNEDNDVPDDPGPYGQMGWHDEDRALYIYDRYDIWKLDPSGKAAPQCITNGEGRKNKVVIRYQRLDMEDEKSLSDGQRILLTLFNEKDKTAGMKGYELGEPFSLGTSRQTFPVAFGPVKKAKKADVICYGIETPAQAADFRVVAFGRGNTQLSADMVSARGLYLPNPQQASYNWLTTELIEWKAYDGKMTKGILYKPEDFDPKKKYPMIAYFYETLSDGLYRYQPPAPTPSRLNIPFL